MEYWSGVECLGVWSKMDFAIFIKQDSDDNSGGSK